MRLDSLDDAALDRFIRDSDALIRDAIAARRRGIGRLVRDADIAAAIRAKRRRLGVWTLDLKGDPR